MFATPAVPAGSSTATPKVSIMKKRLPAILLSIGFPLAASAVSLQQAPIQHQTLAAAHEQAAKASQEAANHHKAAAEAYRAGKEQDAKHHAAAARRAAKQASELTREAEE
ncbi:hypothetical protein MoryE10_28700 [Methylogaea oryzae]|uniref:Uncharacterized protein n=2 Tax=Methylogaea oryzae TaxID=1295382 RepID=A0A8D4VS31_9GAMM|nr:hypothetical protein MoryE10_28700 [Methylogaea oryzae]